MDGYIEVFGWIVIVVDIMLLLVTMWCVCFNFNTLYREDKDVKEVRFRIMMFVMSIVYSLANFEAIRRHINTFVIVKYTTLNYDTVESLLSDRWYMFITALFMMFLTKKYMPSWFDKE